MVEALGVALLVVAAAQEAAVRDREEAARLQADLEAVARHLAVVQQDLELLRVEETVLVERLQELRAQLEALVARVAAEQTPA
jgi:phage shock protein A